MPNWKKLITSGSDASFNSINVDTFVSASSFVGDGSGLTGVTSYTDTDTLNFLNSINALSGSALQSAIDTEKARIDAILLTADADKDSFAEIVSLINSIDTDNDTAFASFYTASNGRLGDLEAVTSSLEAFTSSLENKTLLSSSAQISSDISGSFTSTSSSIATDINELNTFSSSLNTTILNLTGSFTGDGSGLTGIQTTVVQETTVVDSFSNKLTHSVPHNFGTKNVLVSVYTSTDQQIIPQTVVTTNDNTITVTFCESTSGRIVVAKGGHIVSGSSLVDYTELINIPAGIVSGSSQITITESQISDLVHYTDSNVKTKLDSEGVISGSLPPKLNNTSVDFGTGTVTAATLTGAVTASGIQAGGHILPDTTEIYDLGSSDKRFRDLYLSGSTIDLGGTKISRDSTTGNIEFFDGANNRKSLKVDELTIGDGPTARKIKVSNGKVQFTNENNQVESAQTSYDDLTDIPAGIVSSSSQITITESQISDLVHYTDSNVKTKLDSEGVISGSTQVDYNSIQNQPTIPTVPTNISSFTNDTGYLSSLPTGIISGSAQITAVTETRVGGSLSFWQGTQAQYDALGTYNNSTIYFTT